MLTLEGAGVGESAVGVVPVGEAEAEAEDFA